VDVTPAFERGCATLVSKKMEILDQREMVRNYKRKTDELKLEPRMDYEAHSTAIVRHQSNVSNIQRSTEYSRNTYNNQVSLPMLPHINEGSNNRQSNFNTNLNSTQDRHMARNMTENRLQYEQEFVTQSSFDMKIKSNTHSRSNKVIINHNSN